MRTSDNAQIGQYWGPALALSILLISLGVLCVAKAAATTLAMLLGAFFIVVGVYRILQAVVIP